MECGATVHTGGLPDGRRRLTASILAGIAAGLLCGLAQAQEVKTLRWTPPTERVDGTALSADQLAAHRVLCEPGVDVSVPMPATSWAGVEPGIESCVVRAVDQHGLESADSERVFVQWEPDPEPDAPGQPVGFDVSVVELPPSTGPPGGGVVAEYLWTGANNDPLPSEFHQIGSVAIGLQNGAGSVKRNVTGAHAARLSTSSSDYVRLVIRGDADYAQKKALLRATATRMGYLARITSNTTVNVRKSTDAGEGASRGVWTIPEAISAATEDTTLEFWIVEDAGTLNFHVAVNGLELEPDGLNGPWEDSTDIFTGGNPGFSVNWVSEATSIVGPFADEPASSGTTVEAGLETGAEAGAGFNARVVSRADIAAATSAGSSHGASSTIRAAITEGATAQQVASGVASMAAQLAESTLAGAEVTARAALAASITEGAGAGEAVSRQAATLEQMVAAAEADAVLSAYLHAVAALAAGVEAGDAWAARLTAAATFSGAAEASGTFSEDSVALIAAESEAGAHFAAAVHALAEQLEEATAGATMAGIVSTLAAFSSASSAGAVFESAMRHADALQASAEAGAAFAGVTGELTGHLLESVSAAMVVNSAHQARATWSATAHAGATFVASGDVSALIGALAFVVAAEQRVFTVPAETRTFIVS